MMRPRMTRPRIKPPMFIACVMIGNVGSVVVAGGSRFPIKAAADEATRRGGRADDDLQWRLAWQSV